jgi:hypothetical protein
MNKLLAALVVGAFAFGSLPALAQVGNDKTQSFILTPGEQARLKTERDAAKAKWAAMTPEEKAAMRKAASGKRRSELTTVEEMSMGSGTEYFNAKEGAAATAASKAGPKPEKPTPDQTRDLQKSKGQ